MTDTSGNPNRKIEGRALGVASVGHAFFAATFIGLGIEGLIKGNFTVLWQPVPKWVPSREVLKVLCAVIPLLSGIGLFWRRSAAPAIRVLLAYLLLWLLLLRVPNVIKMPTIDPMWALCQVAVMAAAAWVLYDRFATDWDRRHFRFATGNTGLRIARVLYGLALIPLGLSHFAYLKQTAALVPSWLPWHMAWASITGATFIAAGVAVLVGVLARPVAILTTVQIGLFTVLVWLPVVATHANSFQWDEFVISVALTAGAWVIAESY